MESEISEIYEDGYIKAPCPAVKRDGELCGSVRVSESGYCFAHDPQSAEWRAMGGRARARKTRITKQMKDAGVDRLFEILDESFRKVSAQERSPANLQAMARTADVMMKLAKHAEKVRKENEKWEWSFIEE